MGVLRGSVENHLNDCCLDWLTVITLICGLLAIRGSREKESAPSWCNSWLRTSAGSNEEKSASSMPNQTDLVPRCRGRRARLPAAVGPAPRRAARTAGEVSEPEHGTPAHPWSGDARIVHRTLRPGIPRRTAPPPERLAHDLAVGEAAAPLTSSCDIGSIGSIGSVPHELPSSPNSIRCCHAGSFRAVSPGLFRCVNQSIVHLQTSFAY